MESKRMQLISLSALLAALVGLAALGASGEQPSTLFVLDTSDSDSPAPVALTATHSINTNSHSHSADTTNDSNTRIISDEASSSGSGHTTNNSHKINPTNHQKQASALTAAASNTQPATSRKLEEPAHKIASQQQQQQHQKQQQHQQQQQIQQQQPSNSKPQQYKSGAASSTTTSHEPAEQGPSAPKTEERLLISISSEDSEEPYKKVSSPGYEEPQSSGNSQPIHHHQKRKPSITISIQDANISKHTGGSGTQAVIVRPGEDGQSIVIATVGSPSSSSNNNNNNNNKYNGNKPNQQIASDNVNAPLGQTINGNGQQRPYNEPINNPIQSIIAQHQVTSTTRRPLVNDYNPQPQGQNRPITSTLVEPQRPPIQVVAPADERPQRPSQSGADERPNANYDPVRPTQLTRPTSEPYSGGNGGGLSPSSNNQDLEPAPGGNDPYQQQQQQQQGADNEQRRFPLSEKNCGVMHETRIVGGDEADPDDFMWMAAIIKSKPGNSGEPRPFCGGSLITRRHILTAAHCLEGLAPRDVLVRLGSYDFEDSASSSSADYAIDQFRVPAQYSKKTHVADLAIMRLKTPLSPGDQFKAVCMPQPRRSYVGAFGLVTGYGSQSQTFRKAAPKLRQVTVPIWENRKCSKVYNKTMGDSFLCAGYEEGGKDACQGDSGGPIMAEGPDQKMMIVGVVSHGIGCGSPGYPGVYTRTTTFADWIEKNTRE